MRVLVTGTNGFIGSQVAAALTSAGHEVVAGVRASTGQGDTDNTIACDYARDTRAEDWQPRLKGIDAVVNCVGILRSSRRGSFDAIHRDTPIALFKACQQAGIKNVVQTSAIGEPGDTAFIRSKHEADAALAEMHLHWVIIRPSVVYSVSGSYGGTSLMRAMAALPWVLFVPGWKDRMLQPITAEDLGYIVAYALENDTANHQILEAVSPEPISFRQYLLTLRGWLGFKKPVMTIRIPFWLVWPIALLGQLFGRGPLGLTLYRMLKRGNVGSEDAYQNLQSFIDIAPDSVERACRRAPSFVQDRWHARMYFVRPLLRVFIGLLWVASGAVGLVLPLTDSAPVMSALGLPMADAAYVIYGSSAVDIVLGLMVLLRWHLALAGVLMLLSVLAYTGILGFFMPGLWLEPFGSLIKNIPLIPAILAMMAIDDVR